MIKRAHQMEETRRRIVVATVELHGSRGPARTTISAIAQSAGVTRATVYQHFPDKDALYAACTAHWAGEQHLPDLAGWSLIPDPESRVRVALTDLYRFFDETEEMLTLVTRDHEALPGFVLEANEHTARTQIELVLSAWPPRQRTKRRRAMIAHAMTFATWRSLCRDQELSRREAVAAMTRLVSYR
ncbi:MAG: acrR 1 [Marmoricola sp.]|nr:acrR 1 [Marmoricola sp.]